MTEGTHKNPRGTGYTQTESAAKSGKFGWEERREVSVLPMA